MFPQLASMACEGAEAARIVQKRELDLMLTVVVG
jgi:hypothetical protein